MVAEGVIAQAKFHPSQKTSVAAVRDLIGCKTIYRAREAWFFTYLGYTAEVLRLGASGHVELFRFDAASLRFRGETERARLLCSGQLNLAIPRMAVKLPSGRWIRIGD